MNINKAIEFASRAHAGQTRKYSHQPYVYHPLRVAMYVHNLSNATEEMVQAAVLHDVLEDCPNVTEAQLRENFGPVVVKLVKELTNEKYADIPPLEHHEALKAIREDKVGLLVPGLKSKDLDYESAEMELAVKIKQTNRAGRKAKDRERLKNVSVEAQTIKLADRLDNLKEMYGAPGDFFKKYKSESLALIEVIGHADPETADKIRDICLT